MKLIKKESIILQVITLIVVIVSAFIIVYSLNFYVEKVRSDYAKEIKNSRAKLSLGEILSNKLFIIEDCTIKISSTNNPTIINYNSKKVAKAISDFENILRILQKGGTFKKTIAVNVVGKNQIHEKIYYYKEDNSYNVEVIELSSQIVEIKKISNFITKKVKSNLNNTTINTFQNEEDDVNTLLKQIETYFRRSHESVNIIFYNNTVKINELTSDIEKSKKELNIFRYIVYFLTFIFALILTRLIIKKIEKLISEKQEYLNKIEKSHKTIQDIFDAMPVGVILVNKKREISKINNAALTLIGAKDYKSILCSSCKSVFSVNQEKSCPYDDNILLNEVEIDLVTTKGEIIPVIKNVIPITIDDEDFLLEAFMDISKQKEVELQLKIAAKKAEESDQLKTEFIHNMSHEIRTPLNGILGFSELLNNSNLSKKELKEHIDVIQSSGDQLTHIIDDILEISTLETKQAKVVESQFCLNEILLKQFSIFDIKAKEKKISLILKNKISDNESNIISDKAKLTKIVANLLENAVKFTSEGSIELGCFLRNQKIEIYIKDTGIGIKPESQKTIFDRFAQEEKELSKNVGGLGLGLSIVKENIKLMGGEITLISKKGKGSTFTATIPYKTNNNITLKPKQANNIEPVNSEKHEKYKVLIAEDEKINYLFLSMMLRNLASDIKIIHAKNGKEAVEICRINSDIDIVLMDLKMPIMSGFEATTLIKGLRPGLPVIAQTAYSTEKDKQKAFSSGCDDFISKPIKKDILKNAMNKYIKI